MGYLANFIVYTMAMVGVIVVALLIFKNATTVGGFQKSKYLKLVDTMSLGQRKMLYIVSTGTENFLVAGDSDKTTLISKLDKLEIRPESLQTAEPVQSRETFKETIDMLSKPCYMDKSGIRSTIIYNSLKQVHKSDIKTNGADNKKVCETTTPQSSETKTYSSVMKSLAEKIRG
jgi:flagellar biogenesis protein FliO